MTFIRLFKQNKPGVSASGLFALVILVSVVLLGVIAGSCGVREPSSVKTMKDLERAIKVLEERRDAEVRAIEQEEIQILQLEENKYEVRSDGMRNKIERDIRMKESVLERARGNLANQEKLLEGLNAKRDSLLLDKSQGEISADQE